MVTEQWSHAEATRHAITSQPPRQWRPQGATPRSGRSSLSGERLPARPRWSRQRVETDVEPIDAAVYKLLVRIRRFDELGGWSGATSGTGRTAAPRNLKTSCCCAAGITARCPRRISALRSRPTVSRAPRSRRCTRCQRRPRLRPGPGFRSHGARRQLRDSVGCRIPENHYVTGRGGPRSRRQQWSGYWS